MITRHALLFALMIGLVGVATGASAQTSSQPAEQAKPATPPAATPAPAQPQPPTPPPGPKASAFKGLDVFGSDGQQIGKVVTATEAPDGAAKEIEVRSSGFLGFFANVFMVPADKATIKGGRVELAATSDQAKQWRR